MIRTKHNPIRLFVATQSSFKEYIQTLLQLLKMSERILKMAQKAADEALKKQIQVGLAKVFTELSCKGVAKEIKAGRNVLGNVAYGIRFCVHEKLGPRVDPETLKFSPMTKKAKLMEKKFIKYTNFLLKQGKFKPLPSDLVSKMRKKDKAFEQKIRKRRAERKK